MIFLFLTHRDVAPVDTRCDTDILSLSLTNTGNLSLTHVLGGGGGGGGGGGAVTDRYSSTLMGDMSDGGGEGDHVPGSHYGQDNNHDPSSKVHGVY